ncbi:helix-turn-helix domain-containing protein [Streptomyces triticirhizae]|uniref:helix-turn-helix domain-containing protein n=1 Tax=Streptomyces triticirhizae TaxID=2483353 RepID=UPI001315A2E0|nr:helix-turn-helix transcriptional regulator [Streptomyces triticirhizae]
MNEAEGPAMMNDLEYLGAELKGARERAGLSQRQFATGTGVSQSYVSKVENGSLIPSEEFASRCDLVLGTDGLYERMRARVVERGHPSWFAPYAKLEKQAEEIFFYSVWALPGLLQTEEYARAIFQAANPDQSEDWVAHQVRSRMARKEILAGKNPPTLWVVVQEAALHNRVGGSRVMREQLLFLLEMAEMPRVTILVLPFSAGAPAATDAFIRLRLRDGRGIVYAETALGGQMSESPDQVALAERRSDLLRAEALSPRESIRLLKKIAKGMQSDDED